MNENPLDFRATEIPPQAWTIDLLANSDMAHYLEAANDEN